MESLANISPITDGVVPRTPPHNLDVEQALLGAILVNNGALSDVRAFLQPLHFYEPVHGRIYEAVLGTVDKGETADPVRLKHYFMHDESLADVGGARYLVRLAASAATLINTNEYGQTILDLARRRALILMGEQTAREAYDADVTQTADDIAGELEASLSQFHDTAGPRQDDTFRSSAQVVDSALKKLERARQTGVTGLRTGLPRLDKMLGGLQAPDVTILAGRPSMGKSAVATFLADFIGRREQDAETGDPVGLLYASGEMDAESNMLRAFASAIYEHERRTIPYFDMRTGAIDDDQAAAVYAAAEECARQNIIWMDEGVITPARLKARAQQAKRQFAREGIRLGAVVVDYLQIMRPDGRSGHGGRVEDVTEISQGLRAMAKDLRLPVIALSQLSRNVENRENKRPQLADLRESGAIEQDAANVLFVYRHEYYLTREEPSPSDADKYVAWEQDLSAARGRMELILAKNRNGPLGTVHLTANMAANHFEED